MPDNRVLLQNNETGALEPVDLASVSDAVRSGKYSETDESRAYVRTAGTALPQTAAKAERQVEGGATTESGVEQAAERTRAEQAASVRTARDSALSFIEGVADAASFGVIKERGFEGDLRRQENAGAAFAGQLVGTFAPGPGAVMGAGRAAGSIAARAVLGEIKAGSRAAVAAKALESAVEGAALMGAQSFGTQVSDALLDDKPFVAEALLQDIKLGTAFGLGFGLIGAGAERALSRAERAVGPTTRGEVLAGGGLADPASAVSQRVHSEVRSGIDAMDAMLAEHEGRLGIAEQLGKEGGVPKRLVTEHQKLVGAAQRARGRLDKVLSEVNLDAALSGHDARAYARWRDAMENYQEALIAVDERLTPHLRDAAGMQAFQDLPRAQLGEPAAPREYPREVTRGQVARGELSQWDSPVPVAFELDNAMTPELRAKYEELHGRPYEDMESSLDALAAEREPPGVVSETSENKTNPGRRRGKPAEEPVPVRAAEDVIQNEAAPERNPMTSTAPGRTVARREFSGNALNEAYKQEELVLRPDGWFQTPPVNAEENAQLFSRFQDKMAQDTRAVRARKAASVERFKGGPATPEGPAVIPNEPPPAEPVGTRPARPAAAPRSTPPESPVARRPGGRRAVREYVDQWYAQARERSVISPADRAAAKLRSVVDAIREETGGALDAAGTVDLLRAQKLNPARSSFGTTLDQIVSARQLARAVADAARGRPNVAGKAGRNWMIKWMGERVGGRLGSNLGRRALGSAVGGVVGGPVGYVLGAAFVDHFLGFAGRAAGAAGRVNQKVMAAAAGLMSSKLPIRTAAAAVASTPRYLPGEEPIGDPLKRSMHVRELAANPDAYRAKLREGLGPLAALHPDVVEPAIDAQVRNVVQLSLRAPMIAWSPLGEPLAAGAQDMRRWLALEATANDLDRALTQVGDGAATDTQLEGLRAFHPQAFSRLLSALVSDPDALRKLPRERLNYLSRVIGVPLTTGADPAFVARQQEAWQVAAAPPPNGLNAPPPTPASAGSRQPGNPGVTPGPAQ